MTADQRHIEFYFDFISHNAHLAWHGLPALAARHGCTVMPVPVLFAGFLKTHGQLGPAEVAPKLRWMNRNNLRKAARHGIPLNAPVQHPFHPLFLLRLAAQDMDLALRHYVTGRLFTAVWVDRIDPNDVDAIATYLRSDDFATDALIENASSDAAKSRLRENSDRAVERGVFGVPTMLVGTELFWGFDDMDQLEWHISGQDPLTQVDVAGYERGWEEARAAGQHRNR